VLFIHIQRPLVAAYNGILLFFLNAQTFFIKLVKKVVIVDRGKNRIVLRNQLVDLDIDLQF
jgi:hypothetical protein